MNGADLADDESAGTAPEPRPELPPATVSERLLAFLLDGLAIVLLAGSAGLWIGPMETASGEAAFGLAVLAFFVAYHGVLNAWPGQTPGKWVAGIRAVTWTSGERLSLGRSVLRAAGYFPAAAPLGLGFLWALFNRDRMGWHDYLAASRVTQAREKGAWGRLAVTAGAWLLLAALVAGGAYRTAGLEALADAEMVEAARRTLAILGALEERRKADAGAYSDSLVEIAQYAEVPGDLHQALPKVLLENSLEITLSTGGYRITARARDSRRTPVEFTGPR